MKPKKLISIDDYQESKLKNWYGASRKVYRQCDVDKIRRMRGDYSFLLSIRTRCDLVGYECDRKVRAMKNFNHLLYTMKEKYPNILEFQAMRKIIIKQ